MIEFDREADGRWIAEIPRLPGVMVYGDTKAHATRKVLLLAARVIVERETWRAIEATARIGVTTALLVGFARWLYRV